MFGANDIKSVVVQLDWDPAADDVLPLWRVPAGGATLKAAYATTTNVVNASTANYFDLVLRNGGAAGTATTAISGTAGGTAGWVALTPVAFSLTAGSEDLAAGDVVTLVYNEEGTGTFQAMAVQLDYVAGVGN